jgi:hypothetical protein
MSKDRAIFNQNEKLAMTVNGLESGGMHFNVNEKQADDLVKNEAISKFNTQVDEYVNRFEEHAKALEKAVEEFTKSSACFSLTLKCIPPLSKPLTVMANFSF